MRLRFWIYVSVCVLVVMVVLFRFRPHRPQADSEMKEPPAQSVNPVPESGGPATQATRAPIEASPPPVSISPSTNHGSPQIRVDQLRQALSDQNVPIDFYGRVIDQASNALAGVKLKVYIRHWELMPDAMSNPVRMEKDTDADGRFEIHGVTGDALDIESIQRAGYELEPTQRSFGPSSGAWETPVDFKMWSTNVHEPLITGNKSFHIVPDGRRYAIDLSKGTIAESGSGDLNVCVKYTAEVTIGKSYDWSCEVDVPNGGLLEEVNLNSSMYSAPADGYTPTFHFQQQIKGGQRGSTGKKRFYVIMNQRQEFERITIELFAPYSESVPGLVRIQYAVNPAGGRLLR